MNQENFAYPKSDTTYQNGLTKRELIAATLLGGMLSHEDAWGANRHELARDAVKTADALLEVLSE